MSTVSPESSIRLGGWRVGIVCIVGNCVPWNLKRQIKLKTITFTDGPGSSIEEVIIVGVGRPEHGWVSIRRDKSSHFYECSQIVHEYVANFPPVFQEVTMTDHII